MVKTEITISLCVLCKETNPWNKWSYFFFLIHPCFLCVVSERIGKINLLFNLFSCLCLYATFIILLKLWGLLSNEKLMLFYIVGVESCKVEELSPSSAYVTASFEQSVSVTGCIGQELSSSLLSIYVVCLANWNSSRNQSLVVDLHLQNLTGRGK